MHAYISLGVFLTLCLSNLSLARQSSSPSLARRALDFYEDRFTSTQNYKRSNESIKLIGFQKIKVPPNQLAEWEDHYDAHSKELQKRFPSHFWDRDAKELRIYFPVASAMLQHRDVLVEANELGELEHESIEGDYSVLGRRQTEHVRGVAGNIINNGTIYLAKKSEPVRRIRANVHVYDFGYRSLDHEHHHDQRKRMLEPEGPGDSNVDNGENPDATNNGCVANHGGINCSKAYGIDEGRCDMNPDTCMDYNGWFTDCEKAHKYLYFLGSDCSVSVSMGNCWNEIEAAE